MPHQDSIKHGIVLSGGGAKGAFEIGVLRAIFEGKCSSTNKQPLDEVVCTGTSVGAFNAAILAQEEGSCRQALDYLEHIWRDRIANTVFSCGNGVFRVRGAPFQLLDPGCLIRPFQNFANLAGDAAFYGRFAIERAAILGLSKGSPMERLINSIDISALLSPEPLYELVKSTVNLKQLRASNKQLKIVSSNFKFGIPRVFNKTQITDIYGHEAILASAALPGLFPPVVINDIPYVDGGVTMTTPLEPALEAGATVLHVIYLDPLVEDVPFTKYQSTFETFYRLYNILVARGINTNFDLKRAIGREIKLLKVLGLLEEDKGLVITEKNRDKVVEAQSFSEVLDCLLKGMNLNVAKQIHRYRPPNDLNGLPGLLDFSSKNINYLIELGYQVGMEYDCEKAESSITDSF